MYQSDIEELKNSQKFSFEIATKSWFASPLSARLNDVTYIICSFTYDMFYQPNEVNLYGFKKICLVRHCLIVSRSVNLGRWQIRTTVCSRDG